MIHPIFWLLIGSIIAIVIIQCIVGVVVTNRITYGNPGVLPLVSWLQKQTAQWRGIGIILLFISLSMELSVLGGTSLSSHDMGLFIWLLTLYGAVALLTLTVCWGQLQRWAFRQRQVPDDARPQIPTLLPASVQLAIYAAFFALSGALYLFDLSRWNGILVAVATIWTALSWAFAPQMLRLSVKTIPLESSDWAGLGPRIAHLAGFTGQHFQQVLVVSAPPTAATNAAVVGWPRPTLLLGETLLQQTDWRQRDAIICHELGHLRSARMISLFIGALLQAGILAFLYISLLPQLYPSNLVASLLSSSLVAIMLLYAILMGIRALRHRIEFACDADSARLTGDPLALIVSLATLSALRGGNVQRASATHPATAKRWERILAIPATAPWAEMPVASRQAPFDYAGRTLTQPFVQGAPAPLPPTPWGTLPIDAPARAAALTAISQSTLAVER